MKDSIRVWSTWFVWFLQGNLICRYFNSCVFLGKFCSIEMPLGIVAGLAFTTVPYTALHSTCYICALNCTAPHCTELHCTALHCTLMHCIELHCTALPCTVLHFTALHYTLSDCLKISWIFFLRDFRLANFVQKLIKC